MLPTLSPGGTHSKAGPLRRQGHPIPPCVATVVHVSRRIANRPSPHGTAFLAYRRLELGLQAPGVRTAGAWSSDCRRLETSHALRSGRVRTGHRIDEPAPGGPKARSRHAAGACSVDRALREPGTRNLKTAHACLGRTRDGLGFRLRIRVARGVLLAVGRLGGPLSERPTISLGVLLRMHST